MERTDAIRIAKILFPFSPRGVLERTLRDFFNATLPEPMLRAEFTTLLKDMERRGFVTIAEDDFGERLVTITDKGNTLRERNP